MFESIFTTTTDSTIHIGSAMLSIGTSIILGLIIGIVYMYLCKKEGYGKNFIIGLVILPAIVSVVILLIGSNVARAFSMAGAFALVRFRSAPGNAKDIAIVFFAMAGGLACGLGYVLFAAVFVVVLLLLLVLLNFIHFADHSSENRQLKITIPENLNFNHIFDDLLDKYTTKSQLIKVKTTNMGTMYELTYNVHMKKEADEKTFIDELRMRNGNFNIILGIAEVNADVLN